jgi:hypothetical protein
MLGRCSTISTELLVIGKPLVKPEGDTKANQEDTRKVFARRENEINERRSFAPHGDETFMKSPTSIKLRPEVPTMISQT